MPLPLPAPLLPLPRETTSSQPTTPATQLKRERESTKIAFKTAQSIRFIWWCHLSSWERKRWSTRKCSTRTPSYTMCCYSIELEYDTHMMCAYAGMGSSSMKSAAWKHELDERWKESERRCKQYLKMAFSMWFIDLMFGSQCLIIVHARNTKCVSAVQQLVRERLYRFGQCVGKWRMVRIFGHSYKCQQPIRMGVNIWPFFSRSGRLILLEKCVWRAKINVANE